MKSSYSTMYLIRHGESVWNAKGIVQGHSQSPENTLTETGELQAKNMAESLKHIPFKAIFSSDILRAKRTAKIIALERNLNIKTSQALREKSHGEFEGKLAADYLKLFTKWADMTDAERMHYKISESAETPAEAMDRFIIFLKEIALAYLNETVLVVTHGGPMRDFLVKLGIKSFDQCKGFTNTGYIKVQCDGNEFVVMEIKGLKE